MDIATISKSSSGKDSWAFYFHNTQINFNIWSVLALLSLTLFLIKNGSV